jgi:hypothetical protein
MATYRMRRSSSLTLAGTLLATSLLVVAIRAPHATADTRASVIQQAGRYGPAHGYKVAVSVFDTKTGHIYNAGAYDKTFASESIVKAMIATRLLVQGRMHGTTADRAYRMITRSDDAIASSFYGSVGGDSLINWVKRRYDVPGLGWPPRRPGWWGNTHITSRGLVRFYAKVEKDRKVGPWLLNAMHHARKYGSDGTYQFFGLPSATSGAAIKQGWGDDYDDWSRSADFNTTGFVNNDRYAVAILARGPISTYGSAIGTMLTRTARLLLPGGHFPDPVPTIASLSAYTGKTAGGQQITLNGADFTHVQRVLFGAVAGTGVRVLSPARLQVTTPAHGATRVPVRVVTDHGTSTWYGRHFTFVAPPRITSIDRAKGNVAGGAVVQVAGSSFVGVRAVWFGDARGTSLSVSSTGTSLRVTAPAHAAGTVDIRIDTDYGGSATVPADRFTYGAAPTITGIAPNHGPAGTTITITGTGLDSVTSVLFGAGTPGAGLQYGATSGELTVVAPDHDAGTVDVRLGSPYGMSPTTPADEYTYD